MRKRHLPLIVVLAACASRGKTIPSPAVSNASVCKRTIGTTPLAFDDIARSGLGGVCGATGGNVLCWGERWLGFAHGARPDAHARWIRLPSGFCATKVVVEEGGGCALATDGTVACWNGPEAVTWESDAGERDRAARLEGAVDVVALARARWEICAVSRDGGLRCWQAPVRGGGSWTLEVDDAVDLDMLDFNVCAIRRGGSLRCWLGSGSAPTDLPARASDLSLTAGWPWACVIEDGRVRCFNVWYPEGDIDVALRDATRLVFSGCALRATGQIACWGPDRDFSSSELLTDDIAPGLVASVASPGCLIAADGTAWCWGMNDAGQTGADSILSVPAATVLPGLDDVEQVAASSQRTCVRRKTGTVACFGRTASANPAVGDPTEVAGIDRAIDLSVSQHACVVRDNGHVLCWGSDANGQATGQAYQPREAKPAVVAGVANAVQVEALHGGTCALLADGRVVCWGFHATGTHSPAPTIMTGVSGAQEISGACALLATGAVVCWDPWRGYGRNPDVRVKNGATDLIGGFVRIGNDLAEIDTGTVVADSGRDVVDIGTGSQVGRCLVKQDGTVWCQRYGASTLVDGVSGAIAVSVGHDHVCALQLGGHVLCWGDNQWGQLGLGTTGYVQKPTRVEFALPK